MQNEELNEVHAIRYENLGKDVVEFIVSNLESVKRKRINQVNVSVRISTLSKSVMYLGKMLMFFGMGREVLLANISMKEFIVFYSYMSMFTGNFMSVIQMLTAVQPMLINVRRIMWIISNKTESEISSGIPEYETITFSNVEKTFGDKVLFDKVYLNLNLRDSHAILGVNGSGKTTFTKLLLGEESINKGTLMMDGISYEEYTQKDFSGICYYAARPCVLSGMTLRDNLLLGLEDKKISDMHIHEVCKDFMLDDDIKDMKNGLDTVIGEEVNLSSGQMKKVELVRAAMGNANVIILDEPMANLDEEFRKYFQVIYEKYFKQRKVLVVEHDKKRVHFVDKIISIENGKISECM